MRRSHHHLKPLDIRYCPRCEQPVLPHRVCAKCGWYKGRTVVEIQSEK
jgi:large subunit ribosomal protein L32